jgi:hypothetical protein
VYFLPPLTRTRGRLTGRVARWLRSLPYKAARIRTGYLPLWLAWRRGASRKDLRFAQIPHNGRLVPLSKEKPILDASCIQSNVAPRRARLAVCWEIPFSIPPAQRNAIEGPGSFPYLPGALLRNLDRLAYIHSRAYGRESAVPSPLSTSLAHPLNFSSGKAFLR